MNLRRSTSTPAKGNVKNSVPDRSYLPTGKRRQDAPESPGKECKGGRRKDRESIFSKLKRLNPEGDVETYGEGPGRSLQQRGNSVAS